MPWWISCSHCCLKVFGVCKSWWVVRIGWLMMFFYDFFRDPCWFMSWGPAFLHFFQKMPVCEMSWCHGGFLVVMTVEEYQVFVKVGEWWEWISWGQVFITFSHIHVCSWRIPSFLQQKCLCVKWVGDAMVNFLCCHVWFKELGVCKSWWVVRMGWLMIFFHEYISCNG